jgi:hypothetical protein
MISRPTPIKSLGETGGPERQPGKAEIGRNDFWKRRLRHLSSLATEDMETTMGDIDNLTNHW